MCVTGPGYHKWLLTYNESPPSLLLVKIDYSKINKWPKLRANLKWAQHLQRLSNILFCINLFQCKDNSYENAPLTFVKVQHLWVNGPFFHSPPFDSQCLFLCEVIQREVFSVSCLSSCVSSASCRLLHLMKMHAASVEILMRRPYPGRLQSEEGTDLYFRAFSNQLWLLAQ